MAKKEFKLSRRSKANLENVDKRIKELVLRVLKKSPHDFGIPNHGGKRTPQEQNNLFHQRPKVTLLDGFNGISYHQSGFAWDIFIYFEGKACWTCTEKYEDVDALFQSEFECMQDEGIFGCDDELVWGGDWKRFKDFPHHEIRVKEVKEIVEKRSFLDFIFMRR